MVERPRTTVLLYNRTQSCATLPARARPRDAVDMQSNARLAIRIWGFVIDRSSLVEVERIQLLHNRHAQSNF